MTQDERIHRIETIKSMFADISRWADCAITDLDRFEYDDDELFKLLRRTAKTREIVAGITLTADKTDYLAKLDIK